MFFINIVTNKIKNSTDLCVCCTEKSSTPEMLFLSRQVKCCRYSLFQSHILLSLKSEVTLPRPEYAHYLHSSVRPRH